MSVRDKIVKGDSYKDYPILTDAERKLAGL